MTPSEFLSKAGLTSVWAKIVLLVSTEISKLSTVYAAIVHTHAISDVTGLQSALDLKAPLASPAFTGVPTAPTAEQSAEDLTQIATLGYVNTRVLNAIGDLSGIEYKVVNALPEPSEASAKFIYFVKDESAASGNQYDEYFFIPVTDDQDPKYPGYFEKVGPVAIDLSEYWNTTNLTAITTSDINEICTIVPNLSWSAASASATIGETNSYPTLNNPDSLTVSYESTDTSAATIDASTGAITLVAAGTTTIKAIFAGNTDFQAKTVQYTLTVNAGA